MALFKMPKKAKKKAKKKQKKIYTKVIHGITFIQELTFVEIFMGWNSSNPQEHSWKVLHISHTFAYSPRMFWGLDHNFELLSCGRGRVTFRYRAQSDRPKCNGSEVLVYQIEIN